LLSTSRTDDARVLASHRYLDTLLVWTEPSVLVEKSLEAVAAV
jgi:hypothetical protein